MFGRKRMLARAIAGLNESLGLLSQRDLLLAETTASQAQTMVLLDQSMGLLDRALASADKWQRLYQESAQEKAQRVAELECIEKYPLLSGWVN
jgi:hypothetical protein